MGLTVGEFDAERRFGSTTRGWSIPTPKGDSVTGLWDYGLSYTGDGTRMICCSTSGRSGANGDPGDPFDTSAEALAATRTNSADWLLFKQTDNFSMNLDSVDFSGHTGFLRRLGLSATDRFVIADYNPTGIDAVTAPRGTVRAARPLFTLTSSTGKSFIEGNDYVGTGLINRSTNLLIQGLDIYYPAGDIRAGSYSSSAPVMNALDFEGQFGSILVEDVRSRGLGRNYKGFQGTGTHFIDRRSVQSHNNHEVGTYAQYFDSFTLEETFLWFNGWNGVTFVEGQHGIYGNYDDELTSIPEDWLYRGCTAVNNSNLGLRMRQTGWVRQCVMEDNNNGFDFGANTDPPPGVGAPGNSSNIAKVMEYCFVKSKTQCGNAVGQAMGITFRNNIMRATDGIFVREGGGIDFQASNVLLTSGQTIWDQSGGTVANGNTIGAYDSTNAGTRDLAAYATFLGYATRDDYLAAKENNARWNWDYRLTGQAEFDWICQGYGKSPVPFNIAMHPLLALRARLHA